MLLQGSFWLDDENKDITETYVGVQTEVSKISTAKRQQPYRLVFSRRWWDWINLSVCQIRSGKNMLRCQPIRVSDLWRALFEQLVVRSRGSAFTL
jgi:hypothetical protein